MSFYGFGECLPNHDNFIAIDKGKVDAWGIPTLKIDCMWRENERALLKDMSITAAEMLSAAGARDIEPILKTTLPGLRFTKWARRAWDATPNVGAERTQPGA